jgi:GNAT superfamily N-acetyltransferase
MAYTVTYLQMTAREQLNPSSPVPGLRLEALAATSPLVPELLGRVGADYGWKSARRSPSEWAAWLAERPSRRYARFLLDDEPVGVVVYEPHPGDEVEIKSFGLLPESIGRGLGGAALTLAIEQAWRLLPKVARVWLHTSSKDHPRALPNYHRHGFSTFETRQHDDG